MKRFVILATVVLFCSSAHAQLDRILQHSDKILKGARVAKAAGSEFTPEQELEIGKVVAGKVLFNYPLSKNDKLQEYVSLIGSTLIPYSARANQSWHFAVIQTPIVNAFSTPGNFVFVTTGAIAQMKSETELANVIGHEIAHVTQKHILNEVKKGNVFSAGLDLATDGHGGLSNELGKKVADLAWQKLITKGLGRNEEMEADRLGAAMAAAAGYQSSGMISFLETLESVMAHNTTAMSQFTATHPPNKDRIAALKPAVSNDGAKLDDRFKKWNSSK